MARDTTFAIAGTVVLFLAIIFFMLNYAPSLGFSPTSGTDLITILPGIAIFAIGILIIATVRNYLFFFPAITVMGIGFSFLMGELYDLGIVTPIMLEGLSLSQLQLWIVIISALVGACVTGILSRR